MKLISFKVPFLLFLLVSSISQSSVQGQDDFDAPNQGFQDDAQRSPEDDELLVQMQRIMLWGCYFFTKNVMFDKLDQVQELMSGHPHSERLYRTVIGDLMTDCVTKATPQEMQELITSYGQEDFSIEKYNHFHTFSADKYRDRDFSQEEETKNSAYDAYSHIDQMIQEHVKQSGEGDDYEDGGRSYNEPTFAGLPMSTISSIMRVVFVFSSVSLVVLLIYGAYQKKKNPQQQQQQQAQASEGDKKSKKQNKQTKGKEEKETKETKETKEPKESKEKEVKQKKDD